MTNYFLQTLEHLRHYEEVMLYGNILEVTAGDQEEAIAYLAKEYAHESVAYPFTAPEFEPSAAL